MAWHNSKKVKSRKSVRRKKAHTARKKAVHDRHVGHRHAHVRTVNAPRAW